MNKGDVRAKVIGLLNRRDYTSSLLDVWIDDAQRRAQRIVRIPAMERIIDYTIDTYTNIAGHPGIIIPSDFLELINLSVDDEVLRRADLNSVRKLESLTSQSPKLFARQGSRWRLGPPPETDAVIRIHYYADNPALVLDTDESTLSLVAPELLIYGALSYACDYFLDKRKQSFEQVFMGVVQDLQAQALRDELSGGAVVQPTHAYPDNEIDD